MRTKFHLHALYGVQGFRSEVVIRKIAQGNFLLMVIMETLKYTCVRSFTSIHCMVCKFEK